MYLFYAHIVNRRRMSCRGLLSVSLLLIKISVTIFTFVHDNVQLSIIHFEYYRLTGVVIYQRSEL